MTGTSGRTFQISIRISLIGVGTTEDFQASEQRLGERLYIMACLLWSSLHDYCLARRFTDSYPNWSAICSYYSMVHALRLFWLLAYGSYPTGHKQMADSLTSSGNGTRANWQRDTLGWNRTPVLAEAFERWLAERLV